MPGNPKKSNERRDSSTYNKQQRKNSSGTKKEAHNTNPNNKPIHNQKAQQAAGAAILSAVISPQSSGLIQSQQPVVGLNGFNRGELVEFLNMHALTAYHDTNLDASVRPEKYESSQKPAQTSAWGSKPAFAWGQSLPHKSNTDTTGVMSNGVDFLTELANRSTIK
ncbi:hypothetical protein A0J61_09098 [Choanephora cucurbitarum]|uniref:Uncharacterized protein n=1 Tax=Choanephora cucurbitarum TaxID=101091 RepID=A0A1C7N1G4_9FUNG|nr:hypothetical protein A0J61_09098 [Choanephora cucurbitarum]